MTRRTDYATAEKLSHALLTRDRYGQDAAFHLAMSGGVEAPLAATVLMRTVARVEFMAVGERSDRRKKQR